ncbi:amidohydrolase [Thalassobaculum sp.]|uniref:amidohydrolase n=1 Tax=Thalassobaculum sp. TaxID=2022740 RepID=UPI0032EC1B79
MTANDRVAGITDEVIGWRHRIHADPELGFQEHRTAAFVAERLRSFGLAVHTDVSATAVVATLRRGTGGRSIALRAELDALPIDEAADLPYASRNPGVMHACGHDGHSAILLGAARLLAEDGGFDGTVVFVFQPAEEVVGGGRRMVADGLFERFPVDQVYALHNWPGVPEGHIAVRPGPQMAAVDDFELAFRGKGCHAAMPHLGDDPILAAADFVAAAQRVVSRSIDPLQPAVLSVTQIHGGRFNNFVPTEVVVEGTCRFYDRGLSDHCEAEIRRVADGVAAVHGLTASLAYRRGYPPVINPAEGAALAAAAAVDTVGPDRTITEFAPSMGCEDFAFMLGAAGRGAYAWIGAGPVGPGEGLHGDRFVFNDAVVPVGIRWFLNVVRRALPAQPTSP